MQDRPSLQGSNAGQGRTAGQGITTGECMILGQGSSTRQTCSGVKRATGRAPTRHYLIVITHTLLLDSYSVPVLTYNGRSSKDSRVPMPSAAPLHLGAALGLSLETAAAPSKTVQRRLNFGLLHCNRYVL